MEWFCRFRLYLLQLDRTEAVHLPSLCCLPDPSPISSPDGVLYNCQDSPPWLCLQGACLTCLGMKLSLALHRGRQPACLSSCVCDTLKLSVAHALLDCQPLKGRNSVTAIWTDMFTYLAAFIGICHSLLWAGHLVLILRKALGEGGGLNHPDLAWWINNSSSKNCVARSAVWTWHNLEWPGEESQWPLVYIGLTCGLTTGGFLN